ncbi:MAG: DUF6787 family protein [Alphaproteobacteria bacterium]
MISQLLKIFHVENIYKLAAIFFVFSLSGIISLYLSDIVTNFLKLHISNSNFLLSIRILTLFILYQFVILFVAIPLVQLSDFLSYQKKFLKRLSSIFLFFLNK